MKEIATLTLALLLSGCSLTAGERIFVAGAAADIATTAYGLETCGSNYEANRTSSALGGDALMVAATGIAVKYLLWRAAKWIGSDRALGVLGGAYAIQGARNATTGCHSD